MNNRYLEKFKEKSDFELRNILNNHERYTEMAVLAAGELLAKNETEYEIQQVLEIETPDSSNFNFKKFMKDRFSPTMYFKSFGVKLILTNLSIALSITALIETMAFFNDNSRFIIQLHYYRIVLFLLAFVLNNVIYKKETKSSNNFIGRCLNDMFLITILTLISSGVKFVKDPTYSSPILGMSSFFATGMLLFLLSMFLEVFVGLLRRLFERINLDLL